MALTVWCIVVVLGGVVGVGIPVAWLLNGRRPLGEGDFVRAPFLGVATIVLVLQNLVYCNIPIGWSAPALWAAVGLAWIWLWRSGCLGPSLKQCPRLLPAAVLLVYLIQGLGLLVVGPRLYLGRAFPDQFNYTALAQFFLDEPYHLSWASLGNRPYLIVSLTLESDRIGQSVLHAFFAASSFSDAKTLFEPTILLCPALSVLAIYALARRFGLGKAMALAAAAAAGLCPGLTMLHLESFLSHALCTPLLLLFPAVLDELNDRPDAGTLARAALLAAAGAALYTEFWIIFTAISLFSLALGLPRSPRRWRLLACHGMLAAAPFVLNPGAVPSILAIFGRIGGTAPEVDTIYPWALSVEGLGRIWLGDWGGHKASWARGGLRAYALAITVLAFLGLFKAWLERFYGVGGAGGGFRRRSLSFATCVLALALAPLIVFAKDDQHPYQFYKLLLTVSPLLVLGLFLLWPRFRASESDASRPAESSWRVGWRRAPFGLAFGVVLVLAGVSTARMAFETRKASSYRSNAHLLAGPDVGRLQERLPRLPPGNLVLAFQDPTGYLPAWIGYMGRRHRVWMTEKPAINVGWWGGDRAANILDVNHLPPDVLVLTRDCGFLRVEPGEAAPIWSGESFRLWKSASDAWALPVALHNPDHPEETGKQSVRWIGREASNLDVLAGRPGDVILQGTFAPNPDAPDAGSYRVRVHTSAGHESEFVTRGGRETLTIPVPTGKTTIALDAIECPTPSAASLEETPRPLLAVTELTFQFAPSIPAASPSP